jgi:chaperonin GroEL (HSP60 family)
MVTRALIGGGGAPEIHVSRLLSQYAQSLKGMEAYCFQAYADALEVIPTTLAENAGLNPISIVTELRNRHALGDRNAGINVRTVSALSLSHSDYLTTYNLGLNFEYSRGGCRSTPSRDHERD